jgi:sucrose-6-phosphate hydrolase SacC (GH32 family)
MWYIYGIKWKNFNIGDTPERIYKIGHATSQDGVIWQREGRQIISDKFTDENQALPTVIFFNNRCHMFFCYRQSSDFRKNRDRSYRIGYAFSDDMVDWVRDDSKVGIDVTEGSWDSDMLCYPHAFHCDNKIYLLYNGNEFGKCGFGLAQLEDTE